LEFVGAGFDIFGVGGAGVDIMDIEPIQRAGQTIEMVEPNVFYIGRYAGF
jgi:hypothetical protein